MKLVWNTFGEADDRDWWLSEKYAGITSNHYDIHHTEDGKWVIMFIDRNNMNSAFNANGTQLGNPFDGLQEAKNVAEMLHRMEAWK